MDPDLATLFLNRDFLPEGRFPVGVDPTSVRDGLKEALGSGDPMRRMCAVKALVPANAVWPAFAQACLLQAMHDSDHECRMVALDGIARTHTTWNPPPNAAMLDTVYRELSAAAASGQFMLADSLRFFPSRSVETIAQAGDWVESGDSNVVHGGLRVVYWMPEAAEPLKPQLHAMARRLLRLEPDRSLAFRAGELERALTRVEGSSETTRRLRLLVHRWDEGDG